MPGGVAKARFGGWIETFFKVLIPWDQGPINIKLGTKHVAQRKLVIFCSIKLSMLVALYASSFACKCANFTDQNIMQWGT